MLGYAARRTFRNKGFPLGLQSFTVVKPLEADFEGTLKLCAALGYREIETLGTFGRDLAYVRDMLARYGLTTPSQHMMPDDLYRYFQKSPTNDAERKAMSAQFDAAFEPEQVEHFVGQAIERAKALGQRYVVWQLAWRARYTMKDVERYVTAFNKAGAMCAAAGLGFAYHNHDLEFTPTDGRIPFDQLVAHTDPKTVKVEIDFMWATKTGADPVDLFRRFPGRFRLCHLKDRSAAGEIVSTGTGVEDFPALIKAAETAGIEHYYFEYDRPSDPLQEIRTAAAFLKPLLK
jgi:sugar phosphate isomerase/epimerase